MHINAPVCVRESTHTFAVCLCVCVRVHQQVHSHKLPLDFPCQTLLTEQSGKGTSLPCRNLHSPLLHPPEKGASGQQAGTLGLAFFVAQGAALVLSLEREREERVGQEADEPV